MFFGNRICRLFMICISMLLAYAFSPKQAISQSDASSDGLSLLSNDALPAWAELRADIMQSEGVVFESKNYEGPDRSISTQRKISYWLREPFKKFEILWVPDNGARTAYVANTESQFEVDREAEEGSNYYIGDLTEDLSKDSTGFKRYQSILLAAMTAGGNNLHDAVKEKSLKVLSSSANNSDGKEIMSMNLKFKGNTAELNVDLMPSQSWKIIRWNGEFTWGKEEGEIEYHATAPFQSFPKQILIKRNAINGKEREELMYSLELPTKCNEPENSYSLAAYGLSEADFGMSAVEPTRSWGIGAMAINVLLLAFLGFLVVRARALRNKI